MSERIVIAGRGHIGAYVARALQAEQYEVMSYDLADGYNLADEDKVRLALVGAKAVVDTLPYTRNRLIATVAAELGVAYFNLTEDVENTKFIAGLAKNGSRAPLIPQCGLAPGMVSIIAHHLAQDFREVESIRIRVGALPQTKFNHLGYALTWNPAGLINEYCNPCEVLRNGELTTVPPLDGAETLVLNGETYEAAYTSGGIGTLAQSWQGNARHVEYKTLRYPGHFDIMRVLRDDLKLAEHKELAEEWFVKALPRTVEDMVIIGIQVTGILHAGPSQISTRTYVRHVSADTTSSGPRTTAIPGTGSCTTAIQITTAHGVLAVVDAYMKGAIPHTGFVRQEELPYDAIRQSAFSSIYQLPE